MTERLKISIVKNVKNFTKNDEKKIRNELNLKNINSIIKYARDAGVNLGKRKDTQKRRALDYARDIYNDRIDEKNKVVLDERREKKKTETFKKSFIKGLKNNDERVVRKPTRERLRTTLTIMKDNEIDCFDINDGQLVYKKNSVKKAIG